MMSSIMPCSLRACVFALFLIFAGLFCCGDSALPPVVADLPGRRVLHADTATVSGGPRDRRRTAILHRIPDGLGDRLSQVGGGTMTGRSQECPPPRETAKAGHGVGGGRELE